MLCPYLRCKCFPVCLIGAKDFRSKPDNVYPLEMLLRPFADPCIGNGYYQIASGLGGKKTT